VACSGVKSSSPARPALPRRRRSDEVEDAVAGRGDADFGFRRDARENAFVFWLPLFAPHAEHHATLLGLHVSNQLTAGDLIVGVGTLLLAAFAYLSVRVARLSVEAQDAPLLIGANVPASSPVAQQCAGQRFEPPFAGVLPEGGALSFVLRLWNVGRGPAVVQDVRLEIEGKDVLRPMPSHVIVNPAGGVHDAVWASLDLPEAKRDTDLAGTLRIIYAQPNGGLLTTVSRVDLHQRGLYVRTIRRHRLHRMPKGTRPRQPG
jgi:hypothetical protein